MLSIVRIIQRITRIGDDGEARLPIPSSLGSSCLFPDDAALRLVLYHNFAEETPAAETP